LGGKKNKISQNILKTFFIFTAFRRKFSLRNFFWGNFLHLKKIIYYLCSRSCQGTIMVFVLVFCVQQFSSKQQRKKLLIKMKNMNEAYIPKF